MDQVGDGLAVDPDPDDRRAGRAAKRLARAGARVCSAAVARTRRHCQRAPDPGAVLARLRSADPQVRVRTLHGICPCAVGFPLYERFRGEVKRLQKIPIRGCAAALHVERDACEIETIEAELDRAAERGWRYSDDGWVRRKRLRQATSQWLPV
jgi:hypothetical protein